MQRFDMSQSEDRLTLTKLPPSNRMAVGFLLLFTTLASLTPVGILGVMQMGPQTAARSPGDMLEFTDPHANHFGFLWLVGVALVALLLPIYAYIFYRMRLVYTFDRITNRFARNGKAIAPLRRIESVRFTRHDDCDDRPIYRLAVVYSDGFTCELDEWYDEQELLAVGEAVAEFTHTRVDGSALREIEDRIARNLLQG